MNMQDNGTAYLSWRRIEGPEADELFIQCRPNPGEKDNIAQQTATIYRALDSLLREEHGSLALVVAETVFFRDIARDLEVFQRARQQFFNPGAGGPVPAPASSYIQQPPLDAEVDLALSAVAVLPRRGWIAGDSASMPAPARSFSLGGKKYLFAGNILGSPGDAFAQTMGMFTRAEEVLGAEGMSMQDVVRTWIYLREMERDYGEFNRARREFFRQRNVTLLPASTGIYGSPHQEDADLMLSFCAIKGVGRIQASAMVTPTLNEACTYGSDFSRGLRVEEANKIALYISGTASVDEEGRTAHPGDFASQAERMLWNVETLLAAQKASFRDIVSAVTYLKNAGDAESFHRILHDRGLSGMPNQVVHAAVCRPDLLCEIEAIAALPLADHRGRSSGSDRRKPNVINCLAK